MRSSRWLLTIAFVLFASRTFARDSPLSPAEQLLLSGKYAEAEEAFAAAAENDPAAAATGIARCQQATGKADQAEAGLKAAAAAHPRSAKLHAEFALLALQRGDLETASAKADAAILIEPNHAAARWVQAELHRLAGRLKAAEAGYQWLVDYYNATDEIRDPETLHYIGKAAAQYARWNGLSDQFKFLVNDLYPDILAIEKNYWPAHFESGMLFLEKYNQADAANELKKAAAINQHAAEVQAALAELALQNYDLAEAQRRIERALEINSNLLWARQLQADVHLANFDPDRAITELTKARQLNPKSEATLGRLVAAHLGKFGWSEKLVDTDGNPNSARPMTPDTTLARGEGREFVELAVAEINARNPHAGCFYEAVGDGLDFLRRYPAAAEFYASAVESMPQLATARAKLGLVQMRLGDEAAAARELKKAFDQDPFHVRVSNTLKVLEVLANYATLETEHFIIKFDRGQDEILATYASRYLEHEVYPALCKKLGYHPPGKSLFEIFSKAKNTSGHGWFSARMVGLPFIGTVGACAGRMVAIQSPNDARQPFNWARVLRHEFVHVVNLQQTGFNIPHWYTEALAVHNEGFPRPAEWNLLLKQRSTESSLFNLETINTGFIRPKSSGDWTLAYCQAELYAEYMLSRFGDDALAKMLAAYADYLTTPDAIQRSFGVSVGEFEQGYREYVAKIVETVSFIDAGEPELNVLEKAYRDSPGDVENAAELAAAYLRRQNFVEARKLADYVLKKDATNQLATYVLARLKLRAGETEGIVESLDAALNRKHPQVDLLTLLAGLKLKAEQLDEAAKLYRLGAEKFPGDSKWQKMLAQLFLKMGNDEKLYGCLEELAKLDFDDSTSRKKLAELALARKDFAAAERWCREVLQIDVMDANIHHTLAEALVAQDKHAGAIEEYGFAIRIAPEHSDWQSALEKLRTQRNPN